MGLMLYPNIDLKLPSKATQQQKQSILQVVEWFFQNGGASQFEFGMLAWKPFQKTSFVCDFTLIQVIVQ